MVGAFLFFPVVWGFMGWLFWLVTWVFAHRKTARACWFARGLTCFFLVTMVGCGLLLYRPGCERNLPMTGLIFSFLFVGGAVLNQWLWSRALARELTQEEPVLGITRT